MINMIRKNMSFLCVFIVSILVLSGLSSAGFELDASNEESIIKDNSDDFEKASKDTDSNSDTRTIRDDSTESESFTDSKSDSDTSSFTDDNNKDIIENNQVSNTEINNDATDTSNLNEKSTANLIEETNQNREDDGGSSEEENINDEDEQGNNIFEYSNRYAIVIVGTHIGVGSDEQHYNWFRRDAVRWYNLFNNDFSFDETHVLFTPVDEYEKDYDDDLNLGPNYKKCTKLNMFWAFKNIKQKMKDSDLLTVVVVDHGMDLGWYENYDPDLPNEENYNLPDNNPNGMDTYFKSGNNKKVYDFELKSYTSGINAKRIIFILQPCFSGGFIRELSGYNRVVLAASRSSQSAFADFLGRVYTGLKVKTNSLLDVYESTALSVKEDIGDGNSPNDIYDDNLGFQHVLIDDNGDNYGSYFEDSDYNPSISGKDGYIADTIVGLKYERGPEDDENDDDNDDDDDDENEDFIQIIAPTEVLEGELFSVTVENSTGIRIDANVEFNGEEKFTNDSIPATFTAPEVSSDTSYVIIAESINNNLSDSVNINVLDDEDDEETNILYIDCVSNIGEGQTLTVTIRENNANGDKIFAWVNFPGAKIIKNKYGKTVDFLVDDVDENTDYTITASKITGNWQDGTKQITVENNKIPPTCSISGPTNGTKLVFYTFTASGNDPDGDDSKLKYQFKATGKGKTLWRNSNQKQYMWLTESVKTVQVRVKDETGEISDWESCIINVYNHPPTCEINCDEYVGDKFVSYTFTAIGNDPDGDDRYLEYQFKATGKTRTLWRNSNTKDYLWITSGQKFVYARTKDPEGKISEWDSWMIIIN